jgi:hypothetical protein
VPRKERAITSTAKQANSSVDLSHRLTVHRITGLL